MAFAGVLGVAGTLLGGAISGLYAKGRTGQLLILAGVANLLQAPPLLVALSAPDVGGFRLPYFAYAVSQTLYLGAGTSLALSLAPLNMRARLMAVSFVLANVLGAGLGPQIVGLLSDQFSAAGDPRALNHAVACLTGVAALAAGFFFLALRTLPKGLTRPLADT
jgi:MFS family permease